MIGIEQKIDLWLAHDAATIEMTDFCALEMGHRAVGAHQRAQHYADLYEAAQINHDAWLDLLFPIDSECGHEGADGPMCKPCVELARRYEGDAPGEGSAAQWAA